MTAYTRGAPAERFASKVRITDTCWLWIGAKSSKGYGSMWLSPGKSVGVHRWAFEQAFGPIPAGQVVDHKCHIRHCVNPAHLRLATNKQNQENLDPATFEHRGACLRSWGKWEAHVTHLQKRIYLGVHDTEQQALAAARAKRLELFTHNDKDRAEDD